MRSLAILAAALLIGGCAAESTESEVVPAASSCVQVQGTSPNAAGPAAPGAASCPVDDDAEGEKVSGSRVTPQASGIFVKPVKTTGGL